MQTYTGSCHCGRVTFEFRAPPVIDAMRCNCSICRRKGALMTNSTIAPDDISIRDADGQLSQYRFDDLVAAHFFCSYCGIFTFVSTRLNPGEYRVNLGCLEDFDPNAVAIITYDGTKI